MIFIRNTRFFIPALCLIIILLYEFSYGLRTVIPTYTDWLMAARHDWGTHYLGWYFFKSEPWHFPLGAINNYLAPLGTNVGFTDSIPLMAIFFKLFAPVLPEQFQYFGLWLLSNHILMALFGFLLFKKLNLKDWSALMAAVIVSFNPVIIHRAIHPALCSHWLIVASLYFYFTRTDELNFRQILKYQFLLLIISASVNPYICFIILSLSFSLLVRFFLFDKLISAKQLSVYTIAMLISLFFAWYIIGYFTFNNPSDLGIGGAYGLYSFNLNSFYNSSGFSNFIPQLQWVSWHQYEGFMYLGAGVLVVIGVALSALLMEYLQRLPRNTNSSLPLSIAAIQVNVLPLIIFTLLLLVFAITHIVTLNEKILFRLYLPDFIIRIGDIYRASGRFVWVAYYLIMFFGISIISNYAYTRKIVPYLLSIILILQLYDIKNLIFRPQNPLYKTYAPFQKAEIWNKLVQMSDTIVMYPPFEAQYVNSMDYQDFAYIAAKYRKPITTGYAARMDRNAALLYNTELQYRLENLEFEKNTLYISDSTHVINFLLPIKTNRLRVTMLDNYYVLYPNERNEDEFTKLIKIIEKLNIHYLKKEFVRKDVFVPGLFQAEDKQDTIRYSFDSFADKPDFLYVSGWAFVTGHINNQFNSTKFFLASEVDSRIFFAPIYTSLRPDVAAAFKNEQLHKSGFYNVFLKEGLPKGKYKLGIYIINQQTGVGSYFLTDKVLKIGILDSIVPIQVFDLPEPGEIHFNVESLTEEEKAIKMYGWALLLNRNATDNEISIVFKSDDAIYVCSTEYLARPDVTAHFKSQFNYDNSGFSASISNKELKTGQYKIGILIKNKVNGREVIHFTDKTINKK